MATLTTFRRVAVIEATSFLLLLTAAVIKRTADQPVGVQVLGPIHGVLFLAYVYVAWQLREAHGWASPTTALVLLGAILPFGGFVVHRRFADAAVAA